jgi:hypothetical protein
LATIYADEQGKSKTNPFTAAANGRWFFYADDGNYDVSLTDGGMRGTVFLTNLQAIDLRRPFNFRNAAAFGGIDITDCRQLKAFYFPVRYVCRMGCPHIAYTDHTDSYPFHLLNTPFRIS